MKKIMLIFGTRPDAVKMLPLAIELKKHKEFETKICVTAQHREMLDQVLNIFNVKPDYDLDIMTPNQTLEDISGKILIELKKVFEKDPQDLVLVHGDTTTGVMSALEAFYNKIPVGHVEAGLRSFDNYSPFPEEMNRKLIGTLATYHFAPTENNVQNLLNEGIKRENIIKTGNTVIDVLKYTLDKNYVFETQVLNTIDFEKNRVVFVTAHRRENWGQPLENICDALNELTQKYSDVKVIYPVHLNPKVRQIVYSKLENNPNIYLIDPLDVKEVHNLLDRCYLVATDSGGIQEEAPSLGKPVIVLREETERPEAVEAGTVKIVGVKKDDILKNFDILLNDKEEYAKMARAINPYGDGKASEYIAEFLTKIL